METRFVSILVNGSTSEEFSMMKGLRQGDLALFMLLIVVECLGGLIKRVVSLEFSKE